MKFMNVCRKHGVKAAVFAAPLALAANVQAAVPDGAKTAINNALGDASEAGWLVIGAIAGIFVFKLIKRVF